MLEAIGGEVTSQKLNDNFSYLDSNLSIAVLDVQNKGAKGDGITDDSPFIQSAIDNLSGNCFILVPDGTYLLNTDVVDNGKTYNVLMGANVKFIGVGKMPQINLNANHRKNSVFFLSKPSGGIAGAGAQTFASEILPTTDFKGNAVAGMFSVRGLDNGGDPQGGIWGINVLAKANTGYVGALRAIEVDVESDSDVVNGAYGLTFWGNGTQNIDSAILAGRTNFPTTKYKNAIELKHAIVGLFLHEVDTAIKIQEINGYAIGTGILVQSLAKDALKVIPKTDDANPAISGTNAANTLVVWRVNNDGSALYNGLTIGDGTNTKIKQHNSTVVTITPPSIPANGQVDVTATIPNQFDVGDMISVTPTSAPGAGFGWCAFVSSLGIATIRFTNPTTSIRTPTATQWRVDLWKH
jgi:hypothetical protein